MNPDQDVERLVYLLGYKDRANMPISIKAVDDAVKVQIPTPTSVAVLLRYYLEICAPVSRDIVRGLAEFAPSNETKTFFFESSKDKEVFARFVVRKYVDVGRLFELAALLWASVQTGTSLK
jgi:NADPH-ferrihemoprotein reductase